MEVITRLDHRVVPTGCRKRTGSRKLYCSDPSDSYLEIANERLSDQIGLKIVKIVGNTVTTAVNDH